MRRTDAIRKQEATISRRLPIDAAQNVHYLAPLNFTAG